MRFLANIRRMRALLAKPLHLGVILLLLAAVAEFSGLHALFGPENRLMDWMVRLQARDLAPDPDIIIVDIDEASFARMQEVAGKWPWPRAVHAELLAGIEAQQPRAIVFDILFSEEDRLNPASDRLFDESLAGLKNVYLPMVRLDPRDDVRGVPIADVAKILRIEPGEAAQRDARIALLPPQAVDPARWRTGIINFHEDSDGVGRRYWLRMPAHGWRVPSLPVRVADDLGIPVPAREDLLLHWRGAPGSFRHASYATLYEDFSRRNRIRPADEFRGKIVIIGTAATGLQDLRVTPLSNTTPGVEILATAIDNLKNGRWMERVADTVPGALACGMLLLLYAAFRARRHPLQVGVGLAAASAALLGASYAALGARLLAPVLAPLGFAWAFYLYAALLEYLRERRSRQQAVKMFSRFLNPEVVRRIVEQGATVESLSGQTRDISVLFSDIRGFTSLSETRPPQEIVTLLNRYFSRQVEVVFRHGGTLDKFIGDCIMAFWGAPLDDPQHAEHAVAAALEMQQVLLAFRQELGEADAAFDVGIGIHSGSAVVGFIGAEQKLDYTAIGDTVNLASRIEGLTKEAKARVLISRETMLACQNAFDFTARGSYKVKGREQQVELFEPRARMP
jgi:adenylate cyclase